MGVRSDRKEKRQRVWVERYTGGVRVQGLGAVGWGGGD